MNPIQAGRKFLVTGATGFIGTHLMRALVAEHGAASVTAIARPQLNEREAASLVQLREWGVPILECDLLNLPARSDAPPPFDVVYHLAACAEPENSDGDFSSNDVGTGNLLRWLGGRLRGKRFVFTSTLACVDRDRPDGPITETTPSTPRTSYGRTKLQAEEQILSMRADFSYDYTILRLCTIIGKGFRPSGMFGLCPQLLARRALAARLNWPGRSSFLGVTDLIRILLALPERPQSTNQVFVMSNGEDPTFDELLGVMASVLDLKRTRVVLRPWLWRLIGTVAWRLARSELAPHRLKTSCWRASHVIYDGIHADSTKLNLLMTIRYQSVLEGLREAYAK